MSDIGCVARQIKRRLNTAAGAGSRCTKAHNPEQRVAKLRR